MMEFRDLNEVEQTTVKERAKSFINKNSGHVNWLMNDRAPSVAPSGSDLNHPELWKDIHWNWFFDHFAEELT